MSKTPPVRGNDEADEVPRDLPPNQRRAQT